MTVQEMIERKRELGLTNAEISEKTGIPVPTLQKLFSGRTTSPRKQTIQALEKLLSREQNTYAGRPSGRPYGALIAESAVPYNTKKQGDYTLEDYLALPEDFRTELIDGVLYDMGTPTGFHQMIAGHLYAMLLEWIQSREGKCMPFIAPFAVQLKEDDKRTVVEPDVMILCDKGKYTPERVIGAPDFVAEILSPSTRSKDMLLKLNKYRDAGVREYWIIDPAKKTVLVWLFEQQDDYAIYSFRDRIPVEIYGGELEIDFAAIDDQVSPWM